MDPLTHTCSGILLGQALRPCEAVHRRTLIVLAIAAFAPDLDAASYLWGADVYGRLHHLYTHTVVGVVLLAAVLAGVERAWLRGMSFGWLFMLSLAGCSLHVLGDVVAVWPLRILWPWSDRDFVLHWTGDFDLVVLTVVGLATGLTAVDTLRGRERWIIGTAVLVVVAYFVWMPGAAGLR
jgi:membrane-bound metal-dependent hydrolase YbcI (DUF457 family)